MNNRWMPIAAIGCVGAIWIGLPAGAALSPVEVQRIAKQTTVRIKGCSNASGVIIQKTGNTYTILTAAHATIDRGCQIVTADDREYEVTQVTPFINDIDLAVVKFNSSKNYQVAKTIDNSDRIESGENIYISGFPVTATISEPIFTFVAGKVIGNGNKLQANGYSLVYDNPTLPGHSGGPVWNDKGETIAIHGRGDVDTKIKDTESPTVRVKTGFNLGITANTFAKIATMMGVAGYKNNTIAANPPTTPSNSNPKPVVPFVAKPRPVDDLIASAVARERQGDYRGILADMDRAIAIDPKKERLYYIRANAKAELGDRQGAIADYDRDIAMSPQRADSYYNRGTTKYKLGNWQQALADYNIALSIDPQREKAFYNRANVKYQLNDKPGAIADYGRAIAINPNRLEAYSSRAWVRYELGDYEGAISDNNIAIGLKHPRLAKVYSQRAFAQYELNNISAAIGSWRQALSVAEMKSDIQFGLAVALYRQNKQPEALQLAEAAIRGDRKLLDARYLQSKNWGAIIRKDAATLLQNPKIQGIKN
jgi:tetratricopeptide (TPR) repeat protein